MSWIRCGGTSIFVPLILDPNPDTSYPGGGLCDACNHVVKVTPASVQPIRESNQVVRPYGTLATHYVDFDAGIYRAVEYRKPQELDPPEE